MGNLYFILCSVGLLFLFCGMVLYAKKNKDRIIDHLTGWLCYSIMKDRYSIDPAHNDVDRLAFEYAMKHHKKTTWLVLD